MSWHVDICLNKCNLCRCCSSCPQGNLCKCHDILLSTKALVDASYYIGMLPCLLKIKYDQALLISLSWCFQPDIMHLQFGVVPDRDFFNDKNFKMSEEPMEEFTYGVCAQEEEEAAAVAAAEVAAGPDEYLDEHDVDLFRHQAWMTSWATVDNDVMSHRDCRHAACIIDAVSWSRQPLSQWQHSFLEKAVLPLAQRLMTASDHYMD